MSGFKVTQKKDENLKTRLSFEGSIDENSDYSSIDAQFTDEVVFDFELVKHINSTGIKHWVNWITGVHNKNPQLKFTFVNCPKSIVDQINMVDGFLPPNSTIKSFKVPYFCETCEADKTYTFVMDREYKKEPNGNFSLDIPDKTCGKDDCEMEPDVVEQKYFRFLRT